MALFKVIETSDQSKVNWGPGQYIIVDGGTVYYDPTTGTDIKNRVQLSPDLSNFLTKTFASKVITKIDTIPVPNANGTNIIGWDCTVYHVDPSTGVTGSETISTHEFSNDFTVTLDDVHEVYGVELNKADTVTDNDERVITSKAVYNVKTELEEKIAEAQAGATANVTVLTATGAATDESVLDTVSDPKQDDMAIVVRTIGDTGKISRTAYVYNNDEWMAMDGNYNASNVYLAEDILLAGNYTSVGNVNKGSAAATKNAEWDGMSLADILTSIFTQTLNPSKVTPTVSMALSNAGTVEIGTKITPSFTVTYKPGTYTYGSAKDNGKAGGSTYAAPGAVTLTTSAGDPLTGTMTTASGWAGGNVTLTLTGAEIQVDSSTNYKGTSVTCEYGNGEIPYTNTKKEAPDYQVKSTTSPASSSTATSVIKGYREGFFYGTSTNVLTESNLTSAFIRGLSKTKAAYSAGIKKLNGDYTLSVPAGTKTIVFAWPSNKTGATSIYNYTAYAEMLGSFTGKKYTVKVAGADGDAASTFAENYTVVMYSPATAYESAANITVTLG